MRTATHAVVGATLAVARATGWRGGATGRSPDKAAWQAVDRGMVNSPEGQAEDRQSGQAQGLPLQPRMGVLAN